MTREEALNEIRSWAIPSKNGRKVLETLIPELTESEDERIRTELLSFFKGIMADADEDELWYGLPYNDIIAWLEKQKESGIKWLKSDNVKNPDKPYIDKAGMFYTTDGRMCYASEIEKQKEQKPDSLIYDKDLDNAAREFYLSGGAASPVDSTGLVPIVRMAEFGATWMKERMEKEQKPAEWSEEDEKMLASFLHKVEVCDLLTNKDYAWIVKRLKSLRPQPHWKPSEEQMEALSDAYVEASTFKIGDILESLYNDLQKLL